MKGVAFVSVADLAVVPNLDFLCEPACSLCLRGCIAVVSRTTER